jgi:membrane protease YdiL (CAAX protease family)
VAAFLLEISLYAGLGFESVRKRCQQLSAWLPLWLVLSALAPYTLYSVATGVFHWRSLALLAALAAAVSWWFVRLPRKPVFDLAFLALMAGVYLAKLFREIYASPVADLRIEVLGQLMWIRLGVMVSLAIRHMEGIRFGFLPKRAEWLIGLRHFLYFLPPGLLLIYGLHFARFDPAPGLWWKAPATFLGILWVVALSEEFFFRGMLQQWLMQWLGTTAGLLAASLIFGAVHLPFRDFPNWKFAALAALAGWFYGRAYLKADGIRAAMVTHSLVVTTWRTLFS